MPPRQLRNRPGSNSGVEEPHPALEELDPTTAFLFKPRTITFGALGASCVNIAQASAAAMSQKQPRQL